MTYKAFFVKFGLQDKIINSKHLNKIIFRINHHIMICLMNYTIISYHSRFHSFRYFMPSEIFNISKTFETPESFESNS